GACGRIGSSWQAPAEWRGPSARYNDLAGFSVVTPKSKTTRDKATKNSLKVPRRGASLSRRSAETMLNELKSRLLEINDLVAAGSLLNWDQATYMPRGGGP